MIIYLDESGDLGFDWCKPKTSRFFVITLLVCKDKSLQDSFKTAVRRTLKNKLNHRKNNRRVVHELKGEKTQFSVKRYFYDQLPEEGWQLYSVTLNKARVENHLKTKQGKKKLYNFLARFLLEKISIPENVSVVNLVVDRCKTSEEAKDFNHYVSNHLEALLPLETRLHITHESSHENEGLQAVDVFCWGIARKEYGDLEWYQVFQDKVHYDAVYLPECRTKKRRPL